MYTTRELHRNPSPTPDAYDGLWLELLENPDAALPGGDAPGVPDGSATDAVPGAGALGG